MVSRSERTRSPGRWTGSSVVLAAACTIASAAGTPAELEATYRALREMHPDGRSVAVQELVLEHDVFRFSLRSGRIHFLAPVEGRTFGAVFIGEGAYDLLPATESERHVLGLLTRDEKLTVLSDKFSEAVFLFTDDTAARILAAASLDNGAPDARAGQAVENCLKQQRKKIGINYHLRILEELANDDGTSGGVFVGFVDGRRFGKVVFAVDPLGVIDAEEVALIALDDERGGIWYSSHYRGEVSAGPPTNCRNKRLVDALHYEIDTRVRRNEDLEGQTTVSLRVLVPALQVLPFHILPSLRTIEAVRLGASDPPSAVALGFVQEGEQDDSQLAILLDRPFHRGDEIKLRLSYGGDEVLIDDGNGSFRVEARSSWYPNVGNFLDYATYELAFHVPKANRVVSVGAPVSTETAGSELLSTWRSEQPIAVAGFNYGKFELHETSVKNSEMKVEVYASPHDTGGIVEPAIADAVNSIQVYELLFGPLPQKRLAITQQSQWSFGQSWPTLIFMPYLSAMTNVVALNEFVDQVGVHEIAHQWWGHRVGIESYRDEWLSEGFAEFSTALVLEASRGREAYDAFWRRRQELMFRRVTGEDIPGIAAGPVYLGFRAGTARTPTAHQDLVYGKGAYVLRMLREMMRDPKSAQPDAAFFAMLRDFIETHAGATASTEDFRAAVEKHMVPGLNATGDGKIDWFFDQWVYGMEIPRFAVDIDIEEVGTDRYRFVGSIAQTDVSKDFLSLVPLYIDLGKQDLRLFGRAPLRGVMSREIDITLDLPKKPKRVVANAHGEVLAYD